MFYAHYPVLLSGAQGVRVENITFEGGASTGKRGAAITNDNWHVKNCRFQFSAGPGLQITGSDITVEECESSYNGQLNYLIHGCQRLKFQRCTSRRGNTKGFNAAWEAGGTKIVNDWNNSGELIDVLEYLSENDDGPGLWFDINNRSVTLKDSRVVNALAAGVMFEHGFYESYVENVRVEGVRPYPVPTKTWSRQDGFVWQSGVFDSKFCDLYASDCKNAGVYKKHEGRGGSGRITIHRLTGERISGQVLYTETMTDQEILAAIKDGATPPDIASWHEKDDIQHIHRI